MEQTGSLPSLNLAIQIISHPSAMVDVATVQKNDSGREGGRERDE